MRPNPFDSETIPRTARPERFDIDDLLKRADEAVGYGDGDANWGEPPKKRTSKLRWAMRGLGVLVILFVLIVAWLAVTAPLSKSLQPPTPPSITLLASDGTPIARRGAIIGAPVDAAKLPAYVPNAFVAIEGHAF